MVSFPKYGFLSHMVRVKVLLQGKVMNFVLRGYIYQPVGKQVIMNLYMSWKIFDLFMLLFVMFSLIICQALLLISGGCTLSGMGGSCPSKTKIISVCY